MRKFKYLVSYSYSNLGMGMCYITKRKKIKSFNDIDKIRKKLKKELKCREVCILNFKLL